MPLQKGVLSREWRSTWFWGESLAMFISILKTWLARVHSSCWLLCMLGLCSIGKGEYKSALSLSENLPIDSIMYICFLSSFCCVYNWLLLFDTKPVVSRCLNTLLPHGVRQQKGSDCPVVSRLCWVVLTSKHLETMVFSLFSGQEPYICWFLASPWFRMKIR